MTENHEREYEVIVAPAARAGYDSIQSKSDLLAVNKTLDLLASYPLLGHWYDPIYKAAKPRFMLRVVYAGHMGIYYEVNATLGRVCVLYIEDQRMDPESRFDDTSTGFGFHED